MALPNIFNTGRSGMMASKAAIATSGHNISNTNTDGFSRQRVETKTDTPQSYGPARFGTGTLISRVSRINDEFLEKQIRNGSRDMANMEEKDTALRQTEDIFNEMGGDGLNRMMAKFFNEFRKLANDPDNEAIRQSVRESSEAMVKDFKRLRTDVESVRGHLDSRIDGFTKEVNATAKEISELNEKIRVNEATGIASNDLEDKRDVALKKLGSILDITAYKDSAGGYTVDIKGIGPLVVGGHTESLRVESAPADDQGKIEGSFEIRTTASASSNITHRLKGGKLGGLLEVRDKTLSTIVNRLDDLAFNVSHAVNDVHSQGYSREGVRGIAFFNHLDSKARAAEFLDLSHAVKDNVNNIAVAGQPDSPGDNRIAIALSGLQNLKLMNEGKTTVDDYYNSIVADIGTAQASNRNGMTQQKDVLTQLNKMRDQISGVSIDEETANLMQFQQVYGASAKVIQIADEMLKTVLDLKR